MVNKLSPKMTRMELIHDSTLEKAAQICSKLVQKWVKDKSGGFRGQRSGEA